MALTKLKVEAKEILLQLVETLDQITKDEYTEIIGLLSNATIGEHTRHIIEFFQQLLMGYNSGIINYDERNRDLELQLDIDFAITAIANIIFDLDKANRDLKIVNTIQDLVIESNFARELLYNLEHCIHHQAIIKIGLIVLGNSIADDDFGVAKSTLKYREECAQ